MTKLIEAALAHSWPTFWYEELDSTNLEARRRASNSEYGPCWIAAKRQTQGKGRLGRQWSAPEGNLSTTALFPFDGTLKQASAISFIAALAVYDAAISIGAKSDGLQLKWPNDVRSNKHKLAGILIETGEVSSNLNWIAVGIGVNIQSSPNVDQKTISLSELTKTGAPNADNLLEKLKLTFGDRLHSFLKFGFSPIREDWMKYAEGLNEMITVQDSQSQIVGKMKGIDEDGALEVELSDGTQKLITTGDVSLAN